MSWTSERVELLTKLWIEGKSASDIANELGNVTRNAVIGKVHRLGLKGRVAKEATKTEKPVKKKVPPKPKKVEAKVKAKENNVEQETELPDQTPDEPAIEIAINDEIPLEAREQAAQVEKESKRLTLMQLTERTCKWPIGDPATDEFWFCGHSAVAGKPYCEAHVELAFQAPVSRRERR